MLLMIVLKAWRMMCSALLYPDNPSDKLSYEELSWVFDDIPKPIGSIDPSSPLGQVFRKWKVWCTSVCPWLKNKRTPESSDSSSQGT